MVDFKALDNKEDYSRYSVLMSIYEKVSVEELYVSINSMINQTIPPDQFVVVKDGPLSHELNLCIEEYRSKFPDVFTIVNIKKNSGLAVALNTGLKCCRNELVARMDSDDFSVPDRCEKQLAAFYTDTELALVASISRFFKDNPEAPYDRYTKHPENFKSIKKAFRRNNPIDHSSVMYKKSIVLSFGGYDPAMRYRQDYDLFSKMAGNGCRMLNIQEPLLYFRADDNFMERNKSKEICRYRMIVQKRIYERNECSIFDYMLVWAEMTVSSIVPTRLYKIVYNFLKG